MSTRMNTDGNRGLAGWICSALSRRGVTRSANEMEVLERLVLGPRKQLLLVRVGGGRYLVGTGAESIDTIARVEDGISSSCGEVKA